jgi:hypothetical protein
VSVEVKAHSCPSSNFESFWKVQADARARNIEGLSNYHSYCGSSNQNCDLYGGDTARRLAGGGANFDRAEPNASK